MLQALTKFYETYPDSFLRVKGKHRSEIEPSMLERFLDHRERQLYILSEAKVFKIDEDAEHMLSGLVKEMKRDGLEDTYHKVKLPFPAILLERTTLSNGWTAGGLLTQDEDVIFTQRLLVNEGGLMPSMLVLVSSGLEVQFLPTPTQDFMKTLPDQKGTAKILEDEQLTATYLLGLAVGMSTLLMHRGMLEVEETPAYSRPERRRAEKAGRPLPSTRVTRIKLGEAGRGQLDAMQCDLLPLESAIIC